MGLSHERHPLASNMEANVQKSKGALKSRKNSATSVNHLIEAQKHIGFFFPSQFVHRGGGADREQGKPCWTSSTAVSIRRGFSLHSQYPRSLHVFPQNWREKKRTSKILIAA